MEVSDTEKTKYALTVLGSVFFAEVGLMLLQWALSAVGLFNPAIFTAESFLWLLTTGAICWGAWLLSREVKSAELMNILLGLCGLMMCFELFWLVVNVAKLEDGAFRVPPAVSILGQVVGIALTLTFLVVIGKLGLTTAFAFGLGVFAAVRTLISIGFMVVPMTDMHARSWIWPVRLLLSMAVSGGMGALAFQARGALAPAGLGAVSASASPTIAPEPGGGRLIATGLLLLALGIGGTAISYSVAASGSGGGRYVIATGAIATGLVQLIRGLGKLGR